MIASPAEIHVEEIVVNAVLWLRLVIEVIGALMIGVGVALGGLKFARGSFRPCVEEFTAVRLTLARFLALALEFQLGADILSTAVAPLWEASHAIPTFWRPELARWGHLKGPRRGQSKGT